MSYTLVTIADKAPSLTAVAKRVADPRDPAIAALVADMIAVMRAENGIGLAAPQVAAELRVVVFDLGPDGAKTTTPLVCINPVIVKASRDLVMSEEGCLSIPGTFIPVVRAERVSVRYQDQTGARQSVAADGLLAIALQHEIDHLDGILMTERYDQQATLRAQFAEVPTPEQTHRIG